MEPFKLYILYYGDLYSAVHSQINTRYDPGVVKKKLLSKTTFRQLANLNMDLYIDLYIVFSDFLKINCGYVRICPCSWEKYIEVFIAKKLCLKLPLK